MCWRSRDYSCVLLICTRPRLQHDRYSTVYNTTLCFTKPNYTTLFHTTLNHTVLHYTTLCYTTLYSTTLQNLLVCTWKELHRCVRGLITWRSWVHGLTTWNRYVNRLTFTGVRRHRQLCALTNLYTDLHRCVHKRTYGKQRCAYNYLHRYICIDCPIRMCAKTDLRRPVHGLTNTDVRIDTYTGVYMGWHK